MRECIPISQAGDSITSDQFSFDGVTWHLKVYPRGTASRGTTIGSSFDLHSIHMGLQVWFTRLRGLWCISRRSLVWK